MNALTLSRVLPAALLAGGLMISTAEAGLVPDPFFAPDGWNVGDALSTSQTWDDFATSLNALGGKPDVSFDDAGGQLASPTVVIGSPGFIAGSGNPYSFAGPYTMTANISNHTSGLPADAGTHVIVQTFATINPGDGQGNAGTILNASISGAPTAELLRFDTFAYAKGVPSSFGPVDVQATIHEFWLPAFTGDFSVLLDVIVHSSFDQLRIDTAIASAAPDGGSPFTTTVVPEPASLALLGLGSALVTLRRRRAT